MVDLGPKRGTSSAGRLDCMSVQPMVDLCDLSNKTKGVGPQADAELPRAVAESAVEVGRASEGQDRRGQLRALVSRHPDDIETPKPAVAGEPAEAHVADDRVADEVTVGGDEPAPPQRSQQIGGRQRRGPGAHVPDDEVDVVRYKNEHVRILFRLATSKQVHF